MNERRKWTIVLATVAVFVTTAMFLPGLVRAGDLEPTTPPGVPTMHTLDEIYNIVLDTNSKVECESTPVTKTGQTTSYADGDDGELQKGVAWPVPRFIDHGNGTVTDNLTGLMWTNDANIYGQRTWANALSDCDACTEGGHDDWRLPNVRELQGLIDYGQHNPALPAGHPFTSVQSSWYWSSSTNAFYTSLAWSVTFGYGLVDSLGKNGGYSVWCVRGGQ